ncbi:MAG: ribosome biogenesis GTP-binding protein YihA/YsxC [Alphaproteobacteria bacterium]|nr:ribosome biogenesis GTP-binding protein YihA/YsxC [Alphaproteobacteria bacterium]
MQFEIDNFTTEELKEAGRIFSRPCTFVLGVAKLEQLPDDSLNEIAFAGRSNVGKSSIINALTGHNGLAKTSNTPGRTQQINFFNLDNLIHIVDLPGYGFAKAPENIVKQWQRLISTYLQGRANLRRVFLLIDSRHGVKKVDDEIMKMLDKAAVTYQIVLTKTDKINQKDLEKVIADTKKVISEHTAAYARLIATSSVKSFGITELQAEIVSLI